MIFEKARSLVHMNPGEWTFIGIGDTKMLILGCPSCWQQSVIEHDGVSFDGRFNAGKCPYVGCEFDRVGILEGWTP